MSVNYEYWDSSFNFEAASSTPPVSHKHPYVRYKRDLAGKILKDKQGNKMTEKVYADVFNQSEEVFFIANIYELFGVDLNYKGMSKAVNAAFSASKAKTPYKTGYSRSHYKLKKLDNYRVKIYYDRSTFIGGTREGKVVKDYYVIYFAQNPTLFNFLDILIKTFYDELYSQVRTIFEKNEETYGPDLFTVHPTFTGFETFIEAFNKQYYAKREKAKQEMLEKDEAKKKLAEKVKELKAIIKLRQDEKSKIILKRIEEAK